MVDELIDDGAASISGFFHMRKCQQRKIPEQIIFAVEYCILVVMMTL
jgi:hypothetical protein